MLWPALCQALLKEFHIHYLDNFPNKHEKSVFTFVLSLKLRNVRLLAQDSVCEEVVDPRFKLRSLQNGNLCLQKNSLWVMATWQPKQMPFSIPSPTSTPATYTWKCWESTAEFVEREKETPVSIKEEKNQYQRWQELVPCGCHEDSAY